MANWNGALIWIVLLSVLMFVGSVVLVWILIVRMPVDYFTRQSLPEQSFRFRHPVMRIILVVVRNLGGLLLVITGIVMLITPGQGALCILLGLTLLDFPGKRSIIRRILCRRGILRVINRIREKANQPPLDISMANE